MCTLDEHTHEHSYQNENKFNIVNLCLFGANIYLLGTYI